MPFQPWRGGAITPLGISHSKPLLQRYSESTKLLKFSSVEHQLQPPWQHMDTEFGYERWHRSVLCFTGVPRWGHIKIISRSLQGETEKNMIFGFLSIPNSFGVQMIITNDCCWQIFDRVPLYHASPLGGRGDYRLGIPLITPISQSWSESTEVLNWSSVVEIDIESPK